MVSSPTFICDVCHVSVCTRPPPSSFFAQFFSQPYIVELGGRRPGDETNVCSSHFDVSVKYDLGVQSNVSFSRGSQLQHGWNSMLQIKSRFLT